MSSHLDYEINKELGECYLFMGELDKAEDYYTKAAGSNGSHPDPYLGLATIAVQRGQLDRAHAMYKRAADIEADDKSLSGMALVEMETGREDDAMAHFKQALDRNGGNMIALFGLVRMGHATSRVAETVPYLVGFLAIDPSKAEVRYSLAACLAALGRNSEAESQLETLLRSEPSNKPAADLLGQLRTEAKAA
jgi:tetratricopeptide (TPR) repeat protein